MTPALRRTFLGPLLGAALALTTSAARADRFEYLTYAPPPGWTAREAQDGKLYLRNGTDREGIITFHASRPASGTASQEFAATWRALVAPIAPGPPPEPRLQPDGDYTAAMGARQAAAQGATVSVVLVAVVGHGRVLAVVALASGDQVLREVSAFFDSVATSSGAPVATGPATAPPPAPGGEVEVEFAVPTGYVSRREGGTVILAPGGAGEETPCTYGIGPPRPWRGALDADALAALLEEVLPGWHRQNDHYSAMRGTAAAGWPYYWYRTGVQRQGPGQVDYANAMAMAFPAGSGRVHVVWGIGNPAHCLCNDTPFVELFHSLRPRGWKSDGGKALLRDLQGTWRDTERSGMAQLAFGADGRYERGIGAITQLGVMERTSSSVSGGRYALRGSELTLSPDRSDRSPSRYRIRIYDEYVLGTWNRALSLLDEGGSEPQYYRVEGAR